MALQQLCHQLGRIHAFLEPEFPALAYRIERLRQNIRLDFPALQNPPNFTDGQPYPTRYPVERGPFVTAPRENLFTAALAARDIAKLEALVDQILAATARNDKIDRWIRYAKHLNQLEWVVPPSMEHACNATNLCTTPATLCRYMDVPTFLYTLLRQDPGYSWADVEIRNFARALAGENTAPGATWRRLAAIWKAVCVRIRGGHQFKVRPRAAHDVWFWTDGATAVHTPGADPTPDAALKAVRDLGLPGWEQVDDRFSRLGIITVRTLGGTLKTFRPTMLDHMSGHSYFFLPGCRRSGIGRSWPLTPCCQYNDLDNPHGVPEWTVPMPADGVDAFIMEGSPAVPVPAFEMVGIFLGTAHSDLFKP